MRRAIATSLMVAACGGTPAAGDAESASSVSLSLTGMTATGSGTDTTVGTEATGDATGATGAAVSSTTIKWDVAPPDGSPIELPEAGCTKVDFLFIIDNSNSMATNQGELVASFPEFVAGIEGTLVDVSSIHVGVVTSDSYDDNENGCQMTGALVTETGGVNSSNQVCSPYADGARYMTQNDDLPPTFSCAALVGTGGANDEEMMNGALEAISPTLNMAGACNEGFIRDDALLVAVFITDEDDPGSSNNGSPGDPNSWYDDVVAVKTYPENVVVLTLTRGAPQNVCGGAQGSEIDGTRLMAFANLFGANGFTGDICANSFGPFFDEAIGVIESACEGFVEPPG